MASTRLTETMRKAIATAVLNDVPKVNYHDTYRKVYEEECLRLAPEGIRRLIQEGTEDERDWLNVQYVHPFGAVDSFVTFAPRRKGREDIDEHFGDKAIRDLKWIMAEADAQREIRRELYDRVLGALRGCRTYRQVRERLPDLAGYLPDSEEKLKNLPVLSEVPEMLRARGWEPPVSGDGT